MSEINVSELQESVASFTQTVAALKQIQGINAELSRASQRITESAASIAEDTKDLRKYAGETAKAVDELRFQGSSNAREIREKIDQINGKLADDISAVKRDVKKIQAMATTGCIAAIVAAVVAIYSCFFH